MDSPQVPFRQVLWNPHLSKTLRYPPVESTLSKVYEKKRFYPPLESTLPKKEGGRVSTTRLSGTASHHLPFDFLRIPSVAQADDLHLLICSCGCALRGWVSVSK